MKFSLFNSASKKEKENLEEENAKLREELEEGKHTINYYKSMLTDQHIQSIGIESHLKNLKEELNEKESLLRSKENELEAKNREIEIINKEIIELEDIKLLQDFGLYTPMYDFAKSSQYKDELKCCRDTQKRLIKDGTAAVCGTQWHVNNSFAKGKKMINDNIKQIILTFNIECENAIKGVKFNNFDSMSKRIDKIFHKLNKLHASLEVSLSPMYLSLKQQELRLAYEYEQKKQEEKEYIREQRAIARENEKVKKEMEAERKRIEKEQTHYRNHLRQLLEQLQTENDEKQKELIQEKIQSVATELQDLEKAIKDVDYRQANERAGYVYVISNVGSFGEDVYKIGMTRRLDPMDRVNELGDASVPFKYDVHALIFSEDAPKLETALHRSFADRRVNMVNTRKEFYRVSLDEIEKVVKENHDKTVDFNYAAYAQQYRESILLRDTEKKKVQIQ